MILQALHGYYERKRAAGDLVPDGFESNEIPFVVVLDDSGALIQIEDTREGVGRSRTTRRFDVPQSVKKSVNIEANLLWGTAEYALGIDGRGKAARVAQQHASFLGKVRDLAASVNDPGLVAVLRFLEGTPKAAIEEAPQYTELRDNNPNVAFRLSSDVQQLICQRPAVVDEILARAQAAGDSQAPVFCVVQGGADAPARLHPAIRGVWNAQPTGANIVSFNLEAFESYGRKQGENAPIGQRAASAYTKALNHLLRKGSMQRMQIGDASTVFWSAAPSTLEQGFAQLFGAVPESDPDQRTTAIRNLYSAVRNGVYVEPTDRDTEFFVLALAPNAARIAVRFWHRATVGQLAPEIVRHLDDLKIDRASFEPEHMTLFALLSSVAVLGKAENVPPRLGAEVLGSALTGLPYPNSLLLAAIRRIRAEREVGMARAAILKACLNRLIRHRRFNLQEIGMALDRTNINPGYRYGRIFAVLERIQALAMPGINAGIRERYYGAASSAPGTVFPILLKLKNHHLAKLKDSSAVFFEKLLTEIISGIDGFSTHLSLHQQALFAVGYYHQRQDFYARRNDGETADTASGESPQEQTL